MDSITRVTDSQIVANAGECRSQGLHNTAMTRIQDYTDARLPLSHWLRK